MTTVTVVYKDHDLSPEDLTDLLTPLVALCHGTPEQFSAILDREHVGGRGFVTTARLGNASTVLRMGADGTYTAEDPEAVYTMQAAAVSQEEAEQLYRSGSVIPLPDVELTF